MKLRVRIENYPLISIKTQEFVLVRDTTSTNYIINSIKVEGTKNG